MPQVRTSRRRSTLAAAAADDADDKIGAREDGEEKGSNVNAIADANAGPKSPGGYRSVEGNRPTSPKAWDIMRTVLASKRVRSVDGKDIEALKRRGAKLIDVRPTNEFDQGYVSGSSNVPLYQPITGQGAWKVARRAGYAFFGIFNGTEANENFYAQLAEVSSPGDEIIVLCNTGGRLEGSETNAKGMQSRGLMAAYEMVARMDYTNVKFLEGGINQWKADERPLYAVETQQEQQEQ